VAAGGSGVSWLAKFIFGGLGWAVGARERLDGFGWVLLTTEESAPGVIFFVSL
jgi:hypothetical protein